MSSGVVDFAVFYKKQPCFSILIELNPFNDYKGAGKLKDFFNYFFIFLLFWWIFYLKKMKKILNISGEGKKKEN